MAADVVVGEPLEFISEDDLRTFEGWLKYQAIDLAALRSAVSIIDTNAPQHSLISPVVRAR